MSATDATDLLLVEDNPRETSNPLVVRQPLKILMAEDNPIDAELVVRELLRAGFEPAWQRVDTEADFVAHLHGGLDLVLSDFQMPQFSGFRALELVKQRGLDVPFILVSGTIGEDTAVAAMKNGAADYLLKDRLARLGPAIRQALEQTRLQRERHVAAESLRLARAQLGQLIEHSPAVLYVLKLDGEVITPHLVSENVSALLGFTRAETASPGWWHAQVHPDDRERALNSRAETIGTGTSHVEYRLRHKDGHDRWIDDTRRLVRDAAGKAVEVIGVWTDITERKRAEAVVHQASSHVVRDQKKQMRIDFAIIVAATALIYVLASYFTWFEGVTRWFLAHNAAELDEIILSTVFVAAGFALFGFRRARETHANMTSHQQVQAALALMHEELDGRVKQRTEELGNSNQALRAEIVERSRAQTALHESEEQFRQVVENINKVVSILDPATDRLMYISPAYEKVWQRTCASLQAAPRSWLDAIHPEERARVAQADRKKETSVYDEEYRIVQPDGAVRWIHDRAFLVRNPAGSVHRIVGVAEDITDRKQLEEQFRQAQKMEAIGTLAGGIAHDFNNILAAISGYTELAQLVLKANPEVREHLGAVRQATSRATDLVRQILTFSRQQPLERRTIPLQPIVAETLKLLRATVPSTIEFDTSLAADAPAVLADATQIHQIMMNLGTNAWHAMKDRTGRLQVKLERCLVDDTYAAAHPKLRPGVYARVSVSDTGCGMNAATLRRIFEPFFTTKPPGEGTGLGLSVVHGIMDNHDGALTVYSQPDEGTIFHLYFPAHAAELATTATVEGPTPRGQGERILVVDDEELLVRLGQKSLVALGYEVDVETQPAAALARVQKDPERYALVLTDQTMPGMTGFQLAAQLRLVRPTLPVILMTGYSASLTSDRLAAAGIRQLLLKPTSLRSLGIAVHAALASHPPIAHATNSTH